MGAFDGEIHETSKNIDKIEEEEITTKFIRPHIWVFSKYFLIICYPDWADSALFFRFTPSIPFKGYHINSIINFGHQGQGNVFFRWKLVVDDNIFFLGLPTTPRNADNNLYTFAGWCEEVSDGDTYGIMTSSNKTVFLQKTPKLIEHVFTLQIKHIGSKKFCTRFNSSAGNVNTAKTGIVPSSITINKLEKMEKWSRRDFTDIYR